MALTYNWLRLIFTDNWFLELAVLVESTSVGKLVATNKKWNLREGFGDVRAIQKVANVMSRIPITFCMVKHPRVPGSRFHFFTDSRLQCYSNLQLVVLVNPAGAGQLVAADWKL